MKKKFLTLSIIFILMITIVGCSNPGGETKNQYTIVYDSQGGTYISSIYTYEGLKLIKPIDPIKEGYTFLGWYNNDILWDFENNIVNSDIVLTAKWEKNKVESISYHVVLNAAGGNLNEIYIEFTSYIKVSLPIPSKEGYKFLGWYEDDRLIEKLYENKNYTLVAKWKLIQSESQKYYVNFSSFDTDLLITSIEFEDYSEVILPILTKDGYEFLGWYENGKLVTEINENRNYNLVGLLVRNKFYVTFDSQGGSSVPTQEVKNGDYVSKPLNPTKPEYIFDGWYQDSSCTIPVDWDKAITANVIYYAKWEKVLTCAEDRTQEKCLDPDTFDWNYNRFEFDGKGMEIKLYVGIAAENNPFSSGFTGERASERQVVQTNVEDEYNVKIAWTEYPAEAAWGPSRVAWIMDQGTKGIYQGHVFLIDSNWIPTLITNGSIAELYNMTKKTGLFKEIGYTQDPSLLTMTSVSKRVYGYSNGTVRPDTFLYYNQNLVDELGLEDPATLWNEGKWDYAKFTEFADAAMEAFGPDSGKTVLAGEWVRMSQGFLAAAGGKYIDGDLNKVLLSNPKTVKVWENLRALYAKGQIEKSSGSSDVNDNFIAGNTIFNTGSLWFLSSSLRFNVENKAFDISVVPYPTAEGDGAAKSMFTIPMGYESTWAIQPVENGENGISSKIILNILDDLMNSLPPEAKTESLDVNEKYRVFLEKRINSVESVNAIMSVQDGMHEGPSYLYLDLLELVSMTSGEGSHYKLNGFWINYPTLSGEEEPSVALNKLQPIYENTLNGIIYGN